MFFIESSCQTKQKIIEKIGCALDIDGKTLSEWDLMKVIWICLHLRCGRHCILSNFVIELQLNYKK
jgi:hypothetical protein